ncbi:Uncharacterised protein [Segatella copri]|nr:Uncharacterised protein [Segatella copri]
MGRYSLANRFPIYRPPYNGKEERFRLWQWQSRYISSHPQQRMNCERMCPGNRRKLLVPDKSKVLRYYLKQSIRWKSTSGLHSDSYTYTISPWSCCIRCLVPTDCPAHYSLYTASRWH